MPITTPDPWLPLAEAAEYLGMHPQTLRRLIRLREISVSRRGRRGHLRIRRSELDRYMTRNLIHRAAERGRG